MSPTRLWVRYQHAGSTGFGTLHEGAVSPHDGDLFGDNRPAGTSLPLDAVTLLTPCVPGKFLALWNNFHAAAAKQGNAIPAEPLYFIQASSSYLGPGQPILVPPGYGGKVIYEGELGIVIGKTSKQVDEAHAHQHIFGYTCANDVTVADILNRDASFAQWARAKGFDTFCPFGPVVATGIEPANLKVRTLLNGEVRQDYPISDMRFSAAQLVSLISQDMTLHAGDIILCGTSVGVGSMKPGSMVEVEIEGIGRLTNRFE